MIIGALKGSCKKVCDNIKSNLLIAMVVMIAIIVVVGVSVYYVAFRTTEAEAMGRKAIEYISKTYIEVNNSGYKAEFKSAEKFSSVYKVLFSIDYNGKSQNETIYVTKDGRYIFPEMQGVPIDTGAGDSNVPDGGGIISSCENTKKVETAQLEAFVVSKCPYGLQMQRALNELIKQAPASKDNIAVKYIGAVVDGKITAMHGDAEAQENLRQICLREETSQYWSYLSCHMLEGKVDECLASAGVNKANLNTCMADPNKGLKYAQADFTLADQLGVTGSPTLFINGDRADESGFGGRTADALKQIICCGSSTQEGYCAQELSKDVAATSFSKVYSSGASGDTGNADCGPAQ